MKQRGLYGQSEGNEKRLDSARFSERLSDNEIAEGQHVNTLRAKFQDQDWTTFNAVVEDLRKQGFSKGRIDSMISRATSGK